MAGVSKVERIAVRDLLSSALCPQLTITWALGHKHSQNLFSKDLS